MKALVECKIIDEEGLDISAPMKFSKHPAKSGKECASSADVLEFEEDKHKMNFHKQKLKQASLLQTQEDKQCR